MTTAVFAPRAARELRAAVLFVAHENPGAAERLLDEAVTAARRILAHPMHARVYLRLAPERFRFWSLRPFLNLLVIDTAQAPPVVARFVHQSRDLPVVLREV